MYACGVVATTIFRFHTPCEKGYLYGRFNGATL
jgi:hypothetical protein